jgi:hypothetical protein
MPKNCVYCPPEPENIEAIDGIFEADLVRRQRFEIIGRGKNVIALRMLLDLTCC